jgi:ribonuclease Y
VNNTEIIIIITGALIGAVVLAALWRVVYRKRAETQLEEARKGAERIIDDARKAAEAKGKEADLETKEKLLQMRSDFDRQAQQRRDEMKNSERRLQQKEENLDRKTQQIDARIAEVEKRDKAIGDRERGVEQREAELA